MQLYAQDFKVMTFHENGPLKFINVNPCASLTSIQTGETSADHRDNIFLVFTELNLSEPSK